MLGQYLFIEKDNHSVRGDMDSILNSYSGNMFCDEPHFTCLCVVR